jgi:ubiquinone/menaquinone biosynthesis C-methylase UbiE
VPHNDEDSPEDIDAFIDSRALEHPSRLEDEFVNRALNLGVESGMVLDVGARTGLIPLKLLWRNENLYAIGMDRSTAMIERARDTATAWELGERAIFQVGDARRMRFKSAYFDLVVSDCTLHRFDDLTAVLSEIHRVLKPKGALLIRDFRRPKRWDFRKILQQHESHFGKPMRTQLEAAVRAAYTDAELMSALRESGLSGARLIDDDSSYLMLERQGETDPGSWIIAREQYR